MSLFFDDRTSLLRTTNNCDVSTLLKEMSTPVKEDKIVIKKIKKGKGET